MNETADYSALPVDFEGSMDPARLPEVTLGNHTLMNAVDHNSPMVTKSNSGRMSPVRGRTMKEYDQQISDLKKENFSLKMRIYYMEERMQQRFGDGQDVFKTNIELQVEVENLKRELLDKQMLVQKAALAMETLTAKHEQEEESLKNHLLADFKDEMNNLRDQLAKANEDGERHRQDAEEAADRLNALRRELDNIRSELVDSNRMKEELNNKVKSSEFDVQTLTGQLKISDQAKGEKERENASLLQQLRDLEEQLQVVRKQTARQGRDIQNLSNLLQDQSFVDSAPILTPMHLQDEVEDQREALQKKDGRISELEGNLRDKDDVIAKLEDALRDMEGKKREAEEDLGKKEKELNKQSKMVENCKKISQGLSMSLKKKSIECEEQKEKLDKAEEEVKKLREALREAELDKTKALSNLTCQLTEAEDNNRRLKHQLAEANDTAENLIRSLGKKEGELAGFQEQLKKAMDALNRSEEAVEALQGQLKAERADFDNRLREQAKLFQDSLNKVEPNNDMDGLRKQIADLQKLIADQNVELLALAREKDAVKKLNDKLKEGDANLENMSARHQRELSDLERELQSLRSEVNSKDIKIQAMEKHRVWVEDHQRETIHRFRESLSGHGSIEMPDLSVELLQDIKMMMDLLRREMNSFTHLQTQLRGMDRLRDGVNAEVLLTELSSVQRIYRQLEEGVEKNSLLHQALLNSLRGEHRQSDSPDSNSCQDGGYNLGHVHQPTKAATHSQFRPDKLGSPQSAFTPDTASPDSDTFPVSSHGGWGHSPAHSQPQTQRDLIDRSLQTSSSLLDFNVGGRQFATKETSPDFIDRSLQAGSAFSHTDQWVQTSPGAGGTNGNVERDGREKSLITQQDSVKNPSPRPTGKGKVSFVDIHEDYPYTYPPSHHDSLTDDAKEEHLGQCAESLEDYHNFRQGIFFDDDHFDSRRHDRVSSVRASNATRTDSEHITPPSTTNSSTVGSGSGSSGSGSGGGTNLLPRQHRSDLDYDPSPKSRTVGTHKTNVNGDYDHARTSDVDEPDGNGYVPTSGAASLRETITIQTGLHSDELSGNAISQDSHGQLVRKNTTSSGSASRNLSSARISSPRQEVFESGDRSKVPACFIGGGDGLDTDRLTVSPSAHKEGTLGVTKGGIQRDKADTRGGWEENEEVEKIREEEEEGGDKGQRGEGETEDWSEERGERRSRRNSWADELEQYRVHTDNTGETTTKTGVIHKGEDHPQHPQPYHYPSSHTQDKDSHPSLTATARMSSVELRDLVAQLQLDLVDAVKQNHALQKQLEASVSGSKDGDGEDVSSHTKRSSPTGPQKPKELTHSQTRRSHIPRPRSGSGNSASTTGGATTASEDSDVSASHHSLHNGPVNGHVRRSQAPSRIGRPRTASSDRPVSATLQNKLSESYGQIQELQDKLQATENTVRLLSKRNKAFVSMLESAGLSTSTMNRSNSESCLMSPTKSQSPRAVSMGNLNNWESGVTESQSRLSHLVSPRKDISSNNRMPYPDTAASMEKARSTYPHNGLSQTANDLCRSPPAPLITPSTMTLHSSPGSMSREMTTDTSAVNSSVSSIGHHRQQQSGYPHFGNTSLPHMMNGSAQMNKHMNSGQYSKLSPSAQTQGSVNTGYDTTTSPDKFGSHNSTSPKSSYNRNQHSPGQADQGQHDPVTQGHKPGQHDFDYHGSKSGQHHPDHQSQRSPRKHGHQGQEQPSVRFSLGESMLANQSMLPEMTFAANHSMLPEVTYSSMLDNTVMNKLLHNLDQTSVRESASNVSNLSVDQMQVRLEHLERMNLTLREEIGIHEALHRSMGTQVSPSVSGETQTQTDGTEGVGRGLTDEDILRQHLVEIRKLRQRLERLDVTKDPEQLLIFQSHTQQRIIRQEMMISHLQQQMVEKEQQWQRDMTELQHRLAREKTQLVEKLENKLAELQKTIDNQSSTLAEQEKEIEKLKGELEEKEGNERRDKEEMRKIKLEKAELEEDLVKRDREFLDLEKNVFKLEMNKENMEAECRRMKSEAEEKERENDKLRREAEESKEGTKNLKEIVVKREKSLQEKVYVLQKLTSEKTSLDHKLGEREGQVLRLEKELDLLRKENHEMRLGLDEKVALEAENDRLKCDLKRRESLEAKLDFQKAGYEAEIDRLTEEQVKIMKRVDAENREKMELKLQVEEMESKLVENALLVKQVRSLKDEVQSMNGLQEQVDSLNLKLEQKSKVESELRERLRALSHLQSETVDLREKLTRAEEMVRGKEENVQSLSESLREREEKLKKRDKQLQHSINMIKKLDAAITKQKYTVKEKQEQVESLNRQMRLYEVSLSCSSKEEKEDIMRELLKELAATKRQVEDLLSRLEENSAAMKTPAVRVESYGVGSSTTTTITTTSTTGGSTIHHQDIPDALLTLGVTDDTPEGSVADLTPSDLDQEPRPFSALSPRSTNQQSPYRSVSANQGSSPSHLSPRHLKYFVDSDLRLPTGASIPQTSVGSDIRSLFAVLKLDSHEKLRKETGESLVVLSGVEARLNDRLRTFKTKSVTESVEYSTLRETSMSCQNLRTCLEEAARLVAMAWITELPPVDARGHFYDPTLAEQNESLKREVTRLKSQCDMLDHTVKDQQGRLTATNHRCKQWEASLYKQLHKTTQDLEQAKENIDTSLAGLPPRPKYYSFQQPTQLSPQKSPRKWLGDTL